MNFQYYLVKLLSNPHPTVPEYVTVPASWIRSISPDKRVAVSYPPENLHATIGRIEAAEPYNEKWPILMSDVKLGCDDLNEAQRSAEDLNKRSRPHVVRSEKKSQEFVKPKQTAKRAMDSAASVDNMPPQGRGKVRKITPLQKTTSNQDNERDAMNIAMEMANDRQEIAEVFGTAKPYIEDILKTADTIKATPNDAEKITNEFINSRNSKTGGAKRVPKCSPSTSKDNEKTYVFPDNSDTNSKWTLRHKGPGEGLTELLRGSGVYVNSSKLKILESRNNDGRITARRLLREIFSDHAFRLCTVDYGLGYIKRHSPDVFPVLDNYSREVLLMYIQEYCQKRQFYFDEQWFKLHLDFELSLQRRRFRQISTN